MKKLKNIFASNIFYYVVIFFSFVYFLFYINIEHISKYDNFDNLIDCANSKSEMLTSKIKVRTR